MVRRQSRKRCCRVCCGNTAELFPYMSMGEEGGWRDDERLRDPGVCPGLVFPGG